MIWFTSDQHFNHDRDFIYGPRGFNSIDEANEIMLQRWNDTVSEDDEVYQLGDFFLGTDMEFIINILDKLHGKIHIICGNHDSPAKLSIYREHPKVIEVVDAMYLKYEKKVFYLCHYPTDTRNLDASRNGSKIYNLHGHTHSKFKHGRTEYRYNVAVDAHNCYPVGIDTIVNTIEEIENRRIQKSL